MVARADPNSNVAGRWTSNVWHSYSPLRYLNLLLQRCVFGHCFHPMSLLIHSARPLTSTLAVGFCQSLRSALSLHLRLKTIRCSYGVLCLAYRWHFVIWNLRDPHTFASWLRNSLRCFHFRGKTFSKDQRGTPVSQPAERTHVSSTTNAMALATFDCNSLFRCRHSLSFDKSVFTVKSCKRNSKNCSGWIWLLLRVSYC